MIPQPKPYSFGPKRKSPRPETEPTKQRLRTVKLLCDGNDTYCTVEWESLQLNNVIQVFEPNGDKVPGTWLVDGFIPDSSGVFATDIS